MANKFLTIYVGSDMIRVAEILKNGKSQIVLTNAAEISTPAGAYNDGYLLDVTAVAEAVRTAIFGRGFNTKDVIFTIASKKVASKEVELPYVKNTRKLQQVLQANSGDYFPMSNSGDYVFAYSILEDYLNREDGQHNFRISAVAAPMDLVRNYYELAEELKLNVKHIDYFGNSVIQLLALQMTQGRTDLVLQIEMDQTYVNVMRGKTLVLQRNVNYGKTAVTNALMDVKKISEKDAKTLLSNEALLDQHVTADEYAQAVQGLVNGIGRAVEYHRTKNPGDVLQGIKVFGEGSAIAGIEKILERELGARVEHFDTLAGVSIKGQAALTAEEVLRYLPNIGSVIEPMDLSIGNAKKAVVESSDLRKYMAVVLGVAFVGMLGWSGVTFWQHKQAADAKADWEQKIAQIQDIEEIAKAYEQAQYEYVALATFKYEPERNDNNKLLQFILDLEKIMPKGTTINSISAVNGDVTFTVKSDWHSTVKNEIADSIVELKKLDYLTAYSLPDEGEERCIRFVSGYDEEDQPIYLREKSDDQNNLFVGPIFQIDTTKELEELIDGIASGDISQNDLPDGFLEATPVMLTRTSYEITVHIGFTDSIEDVVNEEAGITGKNVIEYEKEGEAAPAEGEGGEEAPVADDSEGGIE
ncbi:type IV pilus assembly protein PilM [Lachnospiraceae bacterium XPB1003]|nr:type IV pilus assembly protein PilM [Lachnospiraceae bacterium XPB1003]